MVSIRSKTPNMATRMDRMTRLSHDSFFLHARILMVIADSLSSTSIGSTEPRVGVGLIVFEPRPVVMGHRQKPFLLLVKPINLKRGTARKQTPQLSLVNATLLISFAVGTLVHGLDGAHFVPML